MSYQRIQIMPDPGSRNRIFLTKVLGSTAGLIQGDFLMGDRWHWLKPRLPRTANGETLLDVGCGSGAFTICAAQRGYKALGLTWDESDTNVAVERAALCRATEANFQICDVRQLDEQADLRGKFDFAICCENIEHILDDRRLVKAMCACLKPGGRLLLTTPNYHYRPIIKGDMGPFRTVEDGWHVRRGYSEGQLRDLFSDTGFIIEHISYCGGFLSQKHTGFLRLFQGKSYMIGWIISLPARLLVPLVDPILSRLMGYPSFSICLEAYKSKWS
jgi:2-polyprenyl-3-methyl-5-hydroxy-6-metoxy-1,4-benzoquinol methylase